MRRTKIISTIGLVSESRELIAELLDAGTDIVRVNFSHATFSQFDRIKSAVVEYNGARGTNVEIMQDLQGPRIRVGKLPEAGIYLHTGERVIFSTEDNCALPRVYIDDKKLPQELRAGEPMYLANGEIELFVTNTSTTEIETEVIRGGTLQSRKGVNVPSTLLSSSGLTDKDLADLKYGLEKGVDWVAISFVQSARDVLKLKELLDGRAKIMTKLETRLGVVNIDEIVEASDAVMVARGDLGIEIDMEELPFVQKYIIASTRRGGKMAVTATQLLTSMIVSKSPTRAEVSDIANAIWDGSDALMLSDETASGSNPVLAVQTLSRVIRATESHNLKPQIS
ncbi:MAG: pyruvate kinase [Candidatus Vogelbacteria bacterium CG10_big_fil_rev_8_21_14_0_10_45_14]|uniref:Pyruvate kinase n=1 Tax=Candidatus Vogelbacteria bacterium CG10_big_fil_rev_8_21_14_0_10_45_14 TaxID=1975042 RepID=A0A2H0RK54_9BACT|nr:MAG: pyruvate kinase [Candidatus Vogelbacteria bacterium CG10_big_fil_rev_8_21_14_0_10_45_14]